MNIAPDIPETAITSLGEMDMSLVPPTVLVVDDDSAAQGLCKVALERLGWKITKAMTARAGLEHCYDQVPDLIILDVRLPDDSGLNFAKKIRSAPSTELVPIVMLSACDTQEDIKAGLAAGADAYLTKPIDAEELGLRVKSLSRLHRTWRELQQGRSVLGEQTRILGLLLDLTAALARTEKLDMILRHTINAAADISFCRRISIMLPDRDKQSLYIASSLGLGQQIKENVRVNVGESIAGRVFESGEPVLINSQEEARELLGEDESRLFEGLPMLSTPLSASENVVGVLNLTQRFQETPFTSNELGFLNLLTNYSASAIQNVRNRIARDEARDSVVVALAKLAEHRDDDTGKHLDRVTIYCLKLASELRKKPAFAPLINHEFMWNLKRAAPLHDIGKVAIPDAILLKPGRLNEEEMAVMRRHTTVGSETIRSLLDRAPDSGFLRMAEEIAESHHEWFNGDGYPNKIAGDAIPVSARILALADVYDALTTERVYKKAMSHRKAVQIISEERGTHFDPTIVDVFLKLEPEFERMAREMSDTRPVNPREIARSTSELLETLGVNGR